MENSRDYIINRAYGLYLDKGYEGVSVSVLQDELGIGRATIYYYFSSKEELFAEIVNQYMVSFIKQFIEKVEQIELTIPKMIECISEMQSNIRQSIIDYSDTRKIKYSHYTALALHAYLHDAKFQSYMRDVLSRMYKLWEAAIKNSIRMGEVRPDVNVAVVAALFTNIKTGDELDMDKGEMSVALPQMFIDCSNYLYSLIKI